MAGKTKQPVAKHSVDELAEAADSLFHTRSFVVKAALKAANQDAYTEKEAQKIVSQFIKKEVK